MVCMDLPECHFNVWEISPVNIIFVLNILPTVKIIRLYYIVKWLNTVKPVFSDHSKIDKTKVLKANYSLIKVESIAECSLGAFCNTFDLN